MIDARSYNTPLPKSSPICWCVLFSQGIRRLGRLGGPGGLEHCPTNPLKNICSIPINLIVPWYFGLPLCFPCFAPSTHCPVTLCAVFLPIRLPPTWQFRFLSHRDSIETLGVKTSESQHEPQQDCIPRKISFLETSTAEIFHDRYTPIVFSSSRSTSAILHFAFLLLVVSLPLSPKSSSPLICSTCSPRYWPHRSLRGEWSLFKPRKTEPCLGFLPFLGTIFFFSSFSSVCSPIHNPRAPLINFKTIRTISYPESTPIIQLLIIQPPSKWLPRLRMLEVTSSDV